MLDERQQQAIKAFGHTIIIAPPGSGKTSTIVGKARHLLEDPATRIAMVTFTRAAAQEMRERIGRVDKRRLVVRTFDSYALNMAKRARLGLKPATAQQVRAATIAAVKRVFKQLKGKIQYGKEVIQRLSVMVHPKPEDRCEEALYKNYLDELEFFGVADFPTIARRVVQGLEDGSIQPYDVTHLLVDEFQDVDGLQVSWILQHAAAGATVTVVGDDDQSIYRFRGALGFGAMRELQGRLDAEVVRLNRCYRCRPEILVLATELISNNAHRYQKDVEAARDAGGVVSTACYGEESIQSEEAIRWGRKHATSGAPLAVLARTNAQLDEIEALCRKHKVDHLRLGGLPFWHSAGPQIVLAMCEALAYQAPAAKLDMSLQLLGLSDRDRQMIRHQASKRGHEGITRARVSHDLAKKLCGNWQQWHGQLRTVPDQCMVDVADWVRTVWDRTKEGSPPRTIALAGEILGDRLKERGLSKFRAIEHNLMSSTGQAPENARIIIATMHASKGLQWSHVWIVGADEAGQLKDSPDDSPDEDKVALKEEERRLYYVAMTRAENWLNITAIKRFGPLFDGVLEALGQRAA